MTFDEIEATLPWGLHDAHLEGIVLDWLGARLELKVRLMISERPDMDQRACITVTGLVYCAIDPPEGGSRGGYPAISEHGLWIDAGAGAAAAGEASRLPETPEGCFLHWIFVHDWNRFIHICGKDASLSWSEPAPVSSRRRFADDAKQRARNTPAPATRVNRSARAARSRACFSRGRPRRRHRGSL